METVLSGRGKWSGTVTAVFFFLQVVTYAVITGYSESYVLATYSEPGPLGWAMAVARAIISQTAIVLFGVAAVKVYQRNSGGLRGVLATLLIDVFIFAFAWPAMWFMRESALHFYQPNMLAGAQDSALSLFGAVLSGRAIDPNIIALLPLYQVGLNVLAPYILAEPKPETTQARSDRMAREKDEAKHKQEMALLRARGQRARINAYLSREQEPELAASEEETPPSADSTIIPLRTAPSVRAKHWTYKELMAYAQAVYGHDMGEVEARRAVQHIGNQTHLSDRRGAPYVASPQACRGWMKGQPWATAKSEDMQEVAVQ